MWPWSIRLSNAVETEHVVIENCNYKLKIKKEIYPFYLYRKLKGMVQQTKQKKQQLDFQDFPFKISVIDQPRPTCVVSEVLHWS